MLCLFYAVRVPFWSDNAATWDVEPRGVHCGVVVDLSTPQDHNRKRFVRTTFVECACGRPYVHELLRRDIPLHV